MRLEFEAHHLPDPDPAAMYGPHQLPMPDQFPLPSWQPGEPEWSAMSRPPTGGGGGGEERVSDDELRRPGRRFDWSNNPPL